MCIPLFILAVGAVFLGAILGHPTGLFDGYLDRTIPGVHAAGEHHGTDWSVVLVSGLVFVAGVGLAWVLYAKPSNVPGKLAAAFGPFTRLSLHKFYLDEIYNGLFVLPLRFLAQISRFFDWLLDVAAVDKLAQIPALIGRLPRPIQNGLVQFYALAMTLAMAVLLWALLTKQG
jgi:NADH-quinone oxidoreductase subunit L